MRYINDYTNEVFSNADDCAAAEKKYEEQKAKERAEKDKLANERKTRAAEVEAARKEMVAAERKYKELIEAFVRDYKSYHYSSHSVDDIPTLFSSFFNWL